MSSNVLLMDQSETDTMLSLLKYPDEAFFKSLSLSEYETDFFNMEYGRGLAYYLNRLDRIMFSGDRVLDAGCGVGQWSIALSHRFKQVDALDINVGRLETFSKVQQHVGAYNISIQEGSVTAIPFPDNTFDAIFCYGVIMFTPVKESLKEFFRVLKPGGRVYICLNGEGWFQMLLDTREDETTKAYMRHILAKTHLERNHIFIQDYLDFQRKFDNAHAELQKILSGFEKTFWKMVQKLPFTARYFAKQIDNSNNLKDIFSPYLTQMGSVGLEQLSLYILQFVTLLQGKRISKVQMKEILDRFYSNPYHSLFNNKRLQQFLFQIDENRLTDPTRAYEPGEFQQLIEEAGFCHFQYANEASLVCDTSKPLPKPMYDGYYKSLTAIWEALLVKPTTHPFHLLPEEHYQEALKCNDERQFVPKTNMPVLSNTFQQTYPLELLRIAEKKAKLAGGESHLLFLIDELCREKVNEEERFRAILHFVQKSMFRDPVSQPLTSTGNIPEDPVTILMTHIGRCGHVSQLLVKMLNLAGIAAEILQLPRHVTVKAQLGGRWVLADADIFKNGIIPMNKQSQILSISDIEENPYLLDRYPCTGWFMQPNTRFTKDFWGNEVRGYIDAVGFEDRGFVSGYFASQAEGHPPSLPVIHCFEAKDGVFQLEWSPSQAKADDLLGYRVMVGTRSRNWSYDDPGQNDEILQNTSEDILSLETTECQVSGPIPSGVKNIYASVTAYSRRVEIEPETFFWPSEEACCVVTQMD